MSNNNLFFGPMENLKNLENPKNYRPQVYGSQQNTRKNVRKNVRKNTKKNNNKNKNKNTLRNKPKGPPFALMTRNELKELEKTMKNYNYM
jgi:hypothetical protein